jgi:hypothetical protein
MSEPGASPDEMPGFPFPRRRVSDLDEPVIDALLTGQPLPSDAPGQAHTVAAMLASLASPASAGPLAGETAARSAFRHTASGAGISRASRPVRRGRGVRARLRLVTAAVAVSAVLGSVAAAWADVLPSPVQELAHQVFGAPAASRSGTHARATKQPASVLCSAYRHARLHGSPQAIAAAHVRLAKAAGGASKIDRYCARILPPGHGQAGHGAGRRGGPGGKSNRARSNGRAKAKGHSKQGVHGQPNGHGGSQSGHGPADGRTGHNSHGGL